MRFGECGSSGGEADADADSAVSDAPSTGRCVDELLAVRQLDPQSTAAKLQAACG